MLVLCIFLHFYREFTISHNEEDVFYFVERKLFNEYLKMEHSEVMTHDM